MRRSWAALGLAVAAATVLAACSDSTPSSTLVLRTMRTVPVVGGTCRGVGLGAVVHGSLDDPDAVWVASLLDPAMRVDVVWPDGYHAVFNPELSIVDRTGRAVLHEGDYLNGGCVTGSDPSDGPLLIYAPPDAFRLDCGPVRLIDCGSMQNGVEQGPNWPRDPVLTFRFTEATGRYEIVLEDGRRLEGLAPPI